MGKELFLTLATVCLLTHIIRSVYEILKHKMILKAGKLSFVIMFINMFLLWMTWFLLCRYDIYKINVPAIIRYMGMFLVVIGIVIFLTALFTIKTLESYEGDLITKGIYSKIRHPMYLGFILWLTGFPLYFGAMFSFFLSFVFIANIMFWRYLEEIDLVKRFTSYRVYKKNTIF